MAKNKLMVCVTSPKTCEKLIARGMERGRDADVHVVHCTERGRKFLNMNYEGDALEYLLTAAQLAGAELSVLRADNVDDALVSYARKNGIGIIIMGASPVNHDHDSILVRLQRRLPDVEFDVVM